MRFLLGLALLVMAIFVLRFLYSRFVLPSQRDQSRQKSEVESDKTEAIIRCRYCGMYFPASEAISGSAGTAFCSKDHRQRYFSAR